MSNNLISYSPKTTNLPVNSATFSNFFSLSFFFFFFLSVAIINFNASWSTEEPDELESDEDADSFLKLMIESEESK